MSGACKRDLGARLRAARRGRTQLSLAAFGREVVRLVGRRGPYSSVTVSNWETGRQEPNWETLVAIARLTGLPLEYFAGVGALEDYAVQQGADDGAERLALESRIVLAASERLDADQRRILAGQLGALLKTLGGQGPSEGASA